MASCVTLVQLKLKLESSPGMYLFFSVCKQRRGMYVRARASTGDQPGTDVQAAMRCGFANNGVVQQCIL